jgi:hypothetical protein
MAAELLSASWEDVCPPFLPLEVRRRPHVADQTVPLRYERLDAIRLVIGGLVHLRRDGRDLHGGINAGIDGGI